MTLEQRLERLERCNQRLTTAQFLPDSVERNFMA